MEAEGIVSYLGWQMLKSQEAKEDHHLGRGGTGKGWKTLLKEDGETNEEKRLARCENIDANKLCGKWLRKRIVAPGCEMRGMRRFFGRTMQRDRSSRDGW